MSHHMHADLGGGAHEKGKIPQFQEGEVEKNEATLEMEEEKFRQEQEEISKRAWLDLITDFTADTTFHGVKYLFQAHEFILRRLIWICIWGGSFSCFAILMFTKFRTWMSHPKAIDVDLFFNDSLPFPAVSICNENPYRLTAIYDAGLYDLVVHDFDNQTSGGCEDYSYYQGILSIPVLPYIVNVAFGDVTRYICRNLCSVNYDNQCSGFLFDRNGSSCTLTSYTGEWIMSSASAAVVAPIISSNSSNQTTASVTPTSTLEFYRRQRCLGTTNFYCDFEFTDGYNCFLNNPPQLSSNKENWELTDAASASISGDNTLNIATGHFMQMAVTGLRLGYTAQLQSVYLNTAGACLQFFYWINSGVDQPMITVFTVSEDGLQTSIATSSPQTQIGWNVLNVALPSGIYQIIIQGQRSWMGSSGLAIDDVIVKPCSDIALEASCMTNAAGNGYSGPVSKTTLGLTCQSWATANSIYSALLPVTNIASAGSKCQNILGPVPWPTPSCLVMDASNQLIVAPCSVSYCTCRRTDAFSCSNGLCLPPQLKCDGNCQCSDCSDEGTICNTNFGKGISCTFSTSYACGYNSTIVGKVAWIRTQANNSILSNVGPPFDGGDATGGYYMIVSSMTGAPGDKVRLASPVSPTTKTATNIIFRYYLPMNASDPMAALTVYIVSPLYTQLLQQLIVTAATSTSNSWTAASVCVPASFSPFIVVFEATRGQPYITDIAIDEVITSSVASCPMVVENYQPNAPTPTVNCQFNNLCGYNITTSSQNFVASFTTVSTYSGPSDEPCGGTYETAFGVITAPGYPQAYRYAGSCLNTINAPSGSYIVLNFTDFNVASSTNCASASLQITSKATTASSPVLEATLCGNTIPPEMAFQAVSVYLIFTTTVYAVGPGYNISYRIISPSSANLFLVMSLTGLGQTGTDTGDIYNMQLQSPPVTLTQASCLTVNFIATAPFTIVVAYTKSAVPYSMTLQRSINPMGVTNTMPLTIPKISADSNSFVIILTSTARDIGVTAAVDYVQLTPNIACPTIDSVYTYSDTCAFTTSNTNCGYQDVSPSGDTWVLVTDSTGTTYMRSEFDLVTTASSVLNSAQFTYSGTTTPCVNIYYSLTSSDLQFTASLIDATSGKPVVSSTAGIPIATYPYANMAVSLAKPSTAVRVQITAKRLYFHSDQPYDAANVYAIVGGACPGGVSNVESLNCTFPSSYACGYTQPGSMWSWAFSPSGAGGMTFTSTPMTIYASSWSRALISPPLTTVNWTTVSVSTTFSSTDLQMNVYLTSSIGQPNMFLGSLSSGSSSVCLPNEPDSADQLAFVFVSDTGSVTLNSVTLTQQGCAPPQPQACSVSVTNQNCLDNFIALSSDSSFSWNYVAGPVPQAFANLLGKALVQYDFSNTLWSNDLMINDLPQGANLDIYFQGMGVDLSATFVITLVSCPTCVNPEIQIWTMPSVGMGTWSSTPATLMYNNSQQITTFSETSKGIFMLQIASNVISQISSINYNIAPQVTSGYSAYSVLLSTTSSTPNIDTGEWVSPLLQPGASSTFCLTLNANLASLTNVYVLLEGSSGISQQVMLIPPAVSAPPGLAPTSMQANVQYTAGATVQNVQAVVQMSVNSAINSVSFANRPCTSTQTGTAAAWSTLCSYSNYNDCGYLDQSTGTAKWVIIGQPSLDVDSIGRADCRSANPAYPYTGNVGQTASGTACVPWSGGQNTMFTTIDLFPDSVSPAVLNGSVTYPTMTSVLNYCRSPSFFETFTDDPWCYTTSNWEFCSIPFCHDYFMYAAFGPLTGSATLNSPIYSGTPNPACVQFQYSISSPKLTLNVLTSVAANTPFVNALTLTYTSQTLTYTSQTSGNQWTTASFTFSSGTLLQLQFNAVKTGATIGNAWVMIDNVVITSGACAAPTVSTTTTTAVATTQPYNGLRTNRFQYMNALFAEYNDMGALMSQIGYQEDEMMFSCIWKGSPCKPSYFTTELGSMGLCFTFNKDPEDSLEIATTGALKGLRLTINLQQYETFTYVTPNQGLQATNSDIGIKVYLHDQNDVADVSDYGFGAPPGIHAQVAFTYEETTSLPLPYGNCGVSPLNYYSASDYTSARCHLECDTNTIVGICGCKDTYMPGPAPTCGLQEYMSCVEPYNTGSGKYANITSTCKCVDQCFVASYTPYLSFSQLSTTSTLAQLSASTSFQQSYSNAIAKTSRLDETSFLQTITLLQAIVNSHNQLMQTIQIDVVNPATSLTIQVISALSQFANMAIPEIQTSGVNFLQNYLDCYYLNMDNVIKSVVAQGTTMIQVLGIKHPLYSVFNKSLYRIIARGRPRMDMLNALKDDLSFSSLSMSILGLPLGYITWSTSLSNTQLSYVAGVTQSITNYLSYLSSSISLLSTVSTIPKCPLSPSAGPCDVTITLVMSQLNNLLSQLNTLTNSNSVATIGQVNSAIQESQQTFSALTTCLLEYDSFLQKFSKWLNSLSVTVPKIPSDMATSLMLVRLNSAGVWLQELLDSYANGSYTTQILASEFTGVNMAQALSDVNETLSTFGQTFLTNLADDITTVTTALQQAYIGMMNNLNALENMQPTGDVVVEEFARALTIWQEPTASFQSPNMFTLALTATQAQMIWPIDVSLQVFVQMSSSTLIVNIINNFGLTLAQALMDIQSNVNALQQTFSSSVQTLQSNLAAYTAATEVNTAFASSNFLEIDFYYSALTYQATSQKISYDMVNFFCDFGAFYGLFLGASVISFFEILDLVIYSAVTKYQARKRHQKAVEEHNKQMAMMQRCESAEPRAPSADKIPIMNGTPTTPRPSSTKIQVQPKLH